MDIWLEKVSTPKDIPNIISRKEFKAMRSKQETIYTMNDFESQELNENHPIKRLSKISFVEDSNEKYKYYFYHSETLIKLNNLQIPHNLLDLAGRLIDIGYCDDFNVIRKFLLGINVETKILEEFNEDCYFLIT